MSGIVGYTSRDGSTQETASGNRMLHTLRHRGPDGSGIWADESTALGQLYLATDHPSPDAFPTAQSDTILTADVRLDNRAELRNKLNVSGHHHSDSELLLAAYDRWGTACPEHLLGAFAFALWDVTRRRLFCARDHLGVKPFYYYQSPSLFAFASEPPGLLTLDQVSHVPNESRIGDYLRGHPDERTQTFYQDIKRLPPGHSLTATAEEIELDCYWSLSAIPQRAEAHIADYQQQFKKLFLDAVAVRMPEGGGVGAFLSGGLDSSSIASVASHLRSQQSEPAPHTFSAIFETVTSCDERDFIDTVVDECRVTPHYIHGDKVDPLHKLDTHLTHRGQPFHPSLFMLIWRLYEEMATADVTVALHGYGGDQAMASDGRGYLRGLLARGQFWRLYNELKAYLDHFPHESAQSVVWSDIVKPFIPKTVRQLRFAHYDSEWFIDRAFAPLDTDFANRTGLPQRIKHDVVSSPPCSQVGIRRRGLQSGELTFNLEMNNIAAAAYGINPRFPYLDKRLVEFLLSIPSGLTVENGVSRTLVRDALIGILPPKIANRDFKTVFSDNIAHTTETYAIDTIEQTLFDGPTAVSSYIDMAGLSETFNAFQSEPAAIDARILLMCTTLERWLDDL